MAEDEEKLSPEEKLLRVIQGSGKKAGDAKREPQQDARPAAVVTPPVTPPVDSASIAAEGSIVSAENGESKPPRAEGDSKLKLAKATAAAPVAKAKAKAGGGAGSARTKPAAEKPGAARAAETASETDTGEGPALAKSAPPVLSFNIGTINLLLALLIVVVLFFTGKEILGNVQRSRNVPEAQPLTREELPVAGVEATLPALNTVLDGISERPIFATFEKPPDPTPPPPREVWTDRCTVLGISEMPDTGELESIIMDNETQKMHFLQVGESVTIDGETYTVESIDAERVLFSYGGGTRKAVVQ